MDLWEMDRWDTLVKDVEMNALNRGQGGGRHEDTVKGSVSAAIQTLTNPDEGGGAPTNRHRCKIRQTGD